MTLLLVAVGTYSLLAGSVTERAEMGVRSELGASRARIVAMVRRQDLAHGIATGATAALVASRALETLLFGVTMLDLLTCARVITPLPIVAIAACSLPAWGSTQLRTDKRRTPRTHLRSRE